MPEGLTPSEIAVVEKLGEVWNALVQEIVGSDRSREADLDEAYLHIHALQRMVMAQSAARAHPEFFRLLGETVRSD